VGLHRPQHRYAPPFFISASFAEIASQSRCHRSQARALAGQLSLSDCDAFAFRLADSTNVPVAMIYREVYTLALAGRGER
jgi:hypothetical protein